MDGRRMRPLDVRTLRLIPEGDFSMEKMNTTTIRHDVLLAAVMLAAFPGEDEHLPSIEEISSRLFQLKKHGIDLGEIALRRVPGGFYSEDIETLVGHYLAAGYAKQMSPVTLTDQGKQVLSEIISEERNENRSAIEQIEAVLGKLAV
jgi:hypothetical protein